MAANDLPVLIVGDVHGDLPRLFAAIKPYPPERWRTIFLGDLVDYGDFGVGALRYARDRANTDVLLGNHEVAMLWALRDPGRVGFWMSIGGKRHDLDELARDVDLQAWIRRRPAMLQLADGTLVQHCGNDDVGRLITNDSAEPVAAINRRVTELLVSGGEAELWDRLSGRDVFASQPERLERWLELTRSRRVVYGHTPHGRAQPAVHHGGRALNFDGGLSRSHRLYRGGRGSGGTVAPLPD